MNARSFKKDDIITNGKEIFKVISIDDKYMRIINVNDTESSASIKEVAKFLWGKYTISHSTEQSTTAKPHSSKFSFSFDPDTSEIIVTWPDGIKTERLQSIKGEKGDSVFEEWCRRTGRKPDANNWEAFLKSLRGIDGFTVNGVDGLSPYEEWKSRQHEGSDTSYTAFLRSITGEKGKDGYEGRDGKDGLSAFEVWKSIQPNGDSLTEKDFWEVLKGDPGKNGHDGIDGKDGDTWKPYVSSDGILYFENTRTGERTTPVKIKGDQGPSADKGENGDTWEPFFPDDGKKQLYFKNNKGEVLGPFNVVGDTGKDGKQGPRGLSAYQLWLKEGHVGDVHDFLMWVSKNADKGADGEDGDTYIPHVEDGVLFFISSKTGKKIPGGRVIGPRGPQGEQGLNGHNIEHEYDYHDLKDFTCPIQEIPERLVSPSGDLNAYGSAEQHMRETLNEIENIREEGKKKANKGSWIQEMFWWCSGADRPLLRMCPTEHSKYMGIGTVIFFTALMAMFSSYVAISYVFGGIDAQTGEMKWSWLAGVFAIFWGLMIFFLDRFITNTMYSDGKVTISWLELRSALPRILISIFLGIVISAPLELKIFKHEIDEFLYQTQQVTINDKYSESLRLNNDSIQQCDSKILEISENKTKIPEFKSQLNQARSDLEKERKKGYSSGYSSKPRRTSYTSDEEFRKAVAAWVTLQNASNTVDQTAKDAALAPYKQRVKELEDTIAALTNSDSEYKDRKEQYEANRVALQNAKQNEINSININSAGLYDRLSALHKIAYQEDKDDGYKPLPAKIVIPIIGRKISTKLMCGILIFILLAIFTWSFMPNVTKNDSTETISRKELRKKGILVTWPWFAVVAIIAGLCCDSLFNALPYFIFSAVGMIMMLFILIDVSPVFYKMMLADGQYEQWHHKEKSVTQDLIRLNFAQSIAQVNNSEVGKLAPMIFSKPWEKIKEILSVARNKQREELGYGESYYTQEIEEDNKRLFKEVMDMKSAIIRAAYAAWYRDMRDSILGIHKESTNGGPDLPPSGDGGDQDSDNAETKRGGTSPDYERDPEDNHSGTPEDQFSEYERKAGTTFEEESDADEDAEEVDIESEEASESEDSSEYSSSDVDDDNEDSHSDEEDYAEDDESDADEPSEEEGAASEDGTSTEASADETTHNPDNPDSEWEHVVDDESEEDNDRKK